MYPISRRITVLSCVACLLAAFCIAACATAQTPDAAKVEPDVLIFKNGDQLTGTLLHGSGNTIVFKSQMAGEITVSLDNVKELRAHANFAVLKKDVPVIPNAIQPGIVHYAEGTLTVTPPAAVSSSVPEKDLAFLVDQATFDRQLREPRVWRGWRGSASAGATTVQSTNYGTTVNLGLNLVRAIPNVAWLPPRNRTIFNVAESYGKLTQPLVPQTVPTPTPDSVAKTNIFHTDFERDQYVSPRLYYLGDLALDHNYSQGLALQQVYGAGAGWTPIQSPRQQLDLKADVHYESQTFQPTLTANQDQNLIGSTFAESYRLILPLKIVLTESGNALPAWNNPNAYSANGNINFALPTFHRLNINIGASDSFINNPAAGFQKNSFQFNTGIGYTFQ